MKLGAIALMFVVPMVIDPGLASHKAMPKDYREILHMLKGIDETLDDLDAAVEHKTKVTEDKDDCRGLSPEKTVRCAGEAFGGTEQALAVWQCESGWGVEQRDDGHIYHGPFQYLISTYQSQQEAIPDVVEWYELSPAVHDMRSNIMTAVAWASRYGWGPWGCA